MSLKRYLLFVSIQAIVLMAGLVFWPYVFGVTHYSSVNWDVHWFNEIALKGYSFDPDKMSSVAFFPLMPWLIQLFQFNYSLIQITLISISVCALGLLTLLSENKTKDVLLFLASPLLFYFMVPYAEALFLFGSTLLLLGLHKRNIPLLVTGAFIAILSRYAATLLLPALLLTFFFDLLNRTENIKAVAVRYSAALISILLGLALVSCIQYQQTGIWNGYQQTHIHWGHALRFPSLPFYSAMGSSMLLLDQVALLISILSGIVILLALWFKYSGKEFIPLTNVQFLSLCYLAGSGASMIAFQGGSLDSLGRYVFATAFIFPLFPLLYKLTYKPVHLIYLFVGCSVFFLLTGSTGSLLHFLSNELVALTLTFFCFLMHMNKNQDNAWNFRLIWLGGLTLQSFLLFLYLVGYWVE